MTSFCKSAQDAYDNGDYQRAVSLYEQAILERPELARIYRFNLERVLLKMSSTELPNDTPSITKSGVVMLPSLYREVAQAVANLPVEAFEESKPLVTVVMTTHNVTEYIEQAVISVLRQSYKPLEVIVVDNASTDGTWRVLQRLSREFPLVIRRLNINLGTYFAKNYGIQLAHGEFVFFQNGDDLSHPERIQLSMRELQQPGVVCVQGGYSRVQFPSGQVLPVNGQVHRLGLITLGVNKLVFAKIGYFNFTMKASDDEFFQRLQAFCQDRPTAVRLLNLPLYYNILHDSPLFDDMINNDPLVGGYIEQHLCPVRQQYVDKFQDVQCNLPIDQFQGFYRFPVTRDLIPVVPEMSRYANPILPVVLSLCSIPERQELLRRTLASIAPQVDEIHLYLDRYSDVPDFVLKCHSRVTVRFSKDFPDLRDNGKFVPLLDRKDECYFFTIDDDIEYPPDYVNVMVKKIEYYGRLAVVGVHGVLIPERPTGYFSGFRWVHLFTRELEQDRLVNNLGTGTVAFHSSRLARIDYRHFSYGGMVDLYLATFCKQQRIPMVTIARHDNWLVEMENETPNLFVEFSQNDVKQSQLVRQHAPWGYAAITQCIEYTVSEVTTSEVTDRLQAMLPLPILRQCLA